MQLPIYRFKACGGHEEKNEDCCEQESGNVTVGTECKTNTHIGCCNHAAESDVKDQECLDDSVTDADKDISPQSLDRLEPMPHFHVPLVDVDKVLCVIGNIVRDRAAEFVATLTYADSGENVHQTDDGEAPLLTTSDGIECACWDKPSKLINGRALFRLKIAQLSSKCDNRLFQIKFNVPKMGKRYPFLEVFSRYIRCISRTRNTCPSTLIWKRSMSAIHAVNGTSCLHCASVEHMNNVVHLFMRLN